MTASPQVRALSFGAVAENYDRYRPSYPPQLVDDVCALLPGRRMVEIGAGTGIATGQFNDFSEIHNRHALTDVSDNSQIVGDEKIGKP